MKKIILFFLFIKGFTGLGQVTVFSDAVTSAAPPALATGWTGTFDWLTDDGTNVPVCNVPGSSGVNMFVSTDASISQTEELISPAFSTMGKSNMVLTFNAYLSSPGTRNPISLDFSVDNGATFPISVPFTNVAANDTWAVINPTIALPGSIDGFTQVKFRLSYTSSGSGELFMIDDIKIEGLNFPVFYYNGTGLIDNFNSWGNLPNGSGIHPTSFTTAAQTFYFVNASTINLSNMTGNSINFAGNTTTLFIGTGTANINLIIPSTHTLSVGSTATLQLANQATLTLQNSSFPSGNNVYLETGSCVDYNHSSGTITAIAKNHYDMSISGGADITYTGSFTVTNNLYLTGGALRMNVSFINTLNLLGPIISSGGVVKTGNSKLNILGSGQVGTLTFAAGATNRIINSLNFNRVGETLTLGSDLAINGTVAIPSGNVNLNGNTLRMSNSATLQPSAANGLFTGSSASAITFSGSGSITNSLFMDQTSSSTRTLKALVTTKSLNLGNALEITDSIKCSGGTLNTGGSLTLKSTSSLKGRIANCTGGSITGNITVETFAAGGTTDWAQLGGSGVSGLTFNSWYGQIPMAIEGSTSGVTSAGGYYFESVQGWDENDAYGYDTTITVTSPITTGKGYWVYLGTGLSTTSDMIWTVSGSVISGPVSVPVSSGGPQSGFNFVANPYPSPISWAQVLSNSPGMQDAVYIYNADVGPTQYVNGVSTHPSTSGANDVIPMGQGFYVESAGAASLNFTESCKVSNNTGSNPLLRSNNSESALNVGTVIRLKIQGSDALDYTAIRFHSNATTAFDGKYDAHKVYDSPGYVGYPGVWSKRTVIATQLNNVDYGINSIPYAHFQNAVLPVIARVYSSGQYTISGQDLQNLPPNACVTLLDKLTNVQHNLKNGPYVCSISDTTYAARFELTICADVTADIKSQTGSASNHINLNKDSRGVFVDFDFDKPTNANITVTNILGQNIMDTKKVKTSKDKIYLDLNTTEQLIFVTVEAENERVTKKLLNFK